MENLANPQDIHFLVSFHPPRVPIPVSKLRELLNTSNGPPSNNEYLRKYAVIPKGPSPAHPLAPPQIIVYSILWVPSTFIQAVVVRTVVSYYTAAQILLVSSIAS